MPILNPDYNSLNFDEMASEIGLKPKHIPLLVGSFLEESKSLLESLGIAIQNMDFEAIKSDAHSIKGSCGNLKFQELYEMSREMELSAIDSNNGFDYEGYYKAIKSAIGTIPS